QRRLRGGRVVDPQVPRAGVGLPAIASAAELAVPVTGADRVGAVLVHEPAVEPHEQGEAHRPEGDGAQRERRAPAVPEHVAQRHLDEQPEAVHAILPSRSRTTRSVASSTCGSWLAITNVTPRSRFSDLSRLITAAPVS